jgi:PIN domain nuclease of toxin-antitoxin system
VINRLLLDTHVALWLDSGDDRLRTSTHSLIDRCWQNGGTVLLSAVTAWEIALLVDTGRIDLDIPVGTWIERFLERPGIDRCRCPTGPLATAISCIISSTATRGTDS